MYDRRKNEVHCIHPLECDPARVLPEMPIDHSVHHLRHDVRRGSDVWVCYSTVTTQKVKLSYVISVTRTSCVDVTANSVFIKKNNEIVPSRASSVNTRAVTGGCLPIVADTTVSVCVTVRHR